MEWSYRLRRDRQALPEFLPRLKRIVETADAFIMVSTEYYQTIPPALTNIINHFDVHTFSGKPTALVCYSGGVHLILSLLYILKYNKSSHSVDILVIAN